MCNLDTGTLQQPQERQQQQGQLAWMRKRQERPPFHPPIIRTRCSSSTYHGSFGQATHGPQRSQESPSTVLVSHRGSEEVKEGQQQTVDHTRKSFNKSTLWINDTMGRGIGC